MRLNIQDFDAFAAKLAGVLGVSWYGAIPKPAAVLANVLQVDLPTTFGFDEALMQPFGSGVFFTSSGLINAS